MTGGKTCVSSVCSLLFTGVMYVGVCVCVRTHTCTLHFWYSDGRLGSQDEILGGPEESRLTESQNIYIRICVHVYIVPEQRDETSD